MPDTVFPGPNVAVAFGAYRLIIWSMFFFVIASWNVFSISLIAYMSASCWSARGEAELSLEPPQPESATTSATAALPIKSFRTVRLLFRGLMDSDGTCN